MAYTHHTSHPAKSHLRIIAIALFTLMLALLLSSTTTTFADDTPEGTISSSTAAASSSPSTATESDNTGSDTPTDFGDSSSSATESADEPSVIASTGDEASESDDESASDSVAGELVAQPELEPGAAETAQGASSTQGEENTEVKAAADEGYQGGTIPILRFTFRDGVDPETGEPITGDEIIELVNTSPNHVYRATDVSCDLEVPASWEDPDGDLKDGVSGYTGESNLELEFFRGRGNSTWRDAKKPYKFKLDTKTDFFGMGKNKHWTLLANSYDATLSIDRIVGYIGEQMGLDYTPRAVPVDLFLNGKYYGNYLLMEEVRIDKNRVDIDEVPSDASDPESEEITGGYLFGTSSKPTSTADDEFFTTRGTPFSYDTPEYASPLTDAQKAQQAYLKSYLDRVEEAVFDKDFVNSAGESVWDLMDQDSFASYWWVQEFSTNRDAFATPSTYLYKTRDQAGAPGTLYWGPLWDFDFVWDGMETEGFDNTNAFEMPWPERLRSDPTTVELLKERWTKLDGILENITRQGGLIDQYIAELTPSWNANNERWNASDRSFDWDNSSCENAFNELRSHFESRRAWINAHLDEIETTFRTITFMDGDDVIFSENSRPGRGFQPDAPGMPKEKDGLLFVGWYSDSGEEYSPDTTYYEDVVFRTKYVDPSSVSAATDIYFPTKEIWISHPLNLNYNLVPTDAKDTRITWTSSDESIATVDSNGYVAPVEGCLDGKETAEVIITAHLEGSGQERSVRVVIYDDQTMTLPQPESITFEKAVSVKVGEYHQLEFTSEPVPNTLNYVFGLTYQVEDENIAEVTDIGVVLGKKPGTTNIVVQRYNQETWEVETVATIALTVVESGSGEDVPAEYTITYKLNGGTLNGSKANVSVRCKDGEKITILQAPTRDGYVFDYWKGSRYAPGDTYTVNGNHVFTAQWKPDKDDSEATHPAKDPKSSSSTKSTSSSARSSSQGVTPRTGDDFDPLPFIVAIGAAALAFVVAFYMRSRKQ